MEISILILNFIVSFAVSTLIIYVVTKLLGEEEGFSAAIVAAFVGSLAYALAYFFLGTGLLAAAIGGVVWLAVLVSTYKTSWLKALLIAIIVWFVISMLSFLPTLVGPL